MKTSIKQKPINIQNFHDGPQKSNQEYYINIQQNQLINNKNSMVNNKQQIANLELN